MQGVVVWCGCRRRPPPATLTHGSTALLNVAVCQTKLQRACAGATAGVAAPLPGLLAHKGSAGLRRCSVEGAKGEAAATWPTAWPKLRWQLYAILRFFISSAAAMGLKLSSGARWK